MLSFKSFQARAVLKIADKIIKKLYTFLLQTYQGKKCICLDIKDISDIFRALQRYINFDGT